jgi:hypothetical protein
MSITFKAFTTIVAEGKQPYSSESYWKGDAEEKGYKVKKLSGDVMKGDQTWGAFNDQDEKVGEFTEKEEGRGGWLMEEKINELFGIFRNNERAEKAKAEREQLKKDTAEKVAAHRAKQAKRNGQGKGDDEEEDDEGDDKKKKMTSQTRSASTKGTRSTQSAAGGRAAERDWVNGMK